MQCNFQITQSVEFDGAFGNLDVHNAYDLVSLDLSEEGSVFRMGFVANQFRLAGKPDEFEVVFTGVTLLERKGFPEDLSTFHTDEIGFMAADDRDYRWALDDGRPGPEKHFVLQGDTMGKEGRLRISAAVASLETAR